jgi:anti-sigma factor RsiW
MLCEEVTVLLPGMVDGDLDVDPAAIQHVETCLRCQAELARYRRLLRTLALLRTRYAEPTPGLLGDTLAALTDAAEEGARRTLLSGRRLAYAGAIGGTAVATAATAALLIARSRRRSMRLAG